MIRVELPAHLRVLAKVTGEVSVEGSTLGDVLSALERDYPALRGTIRDHGTLKRRPFIRFFACREDLSHSDYGAALPAAVLAGDEPLLVVGAMAGG